MSPFSSSKMTDIIFFQTLNTEGSIQTYPIRVDCHILSLDFTLVDEKGTVYPRAIGIVQSSEFLGTTCNVRPRKFRTTTGRSVSMLMRESKTSAFHNSPFMHTVPVGVKGL